MNEMKIKCEYCGGKAEQRGTQHLGAGPNMLSYECQTCKAKILFIKHTSKEIEEIHIDLKYKE